MYDINTNHTSNKYIKLEDIKNFPIRRDHCDKEHADPAFIDGIETVMEFIGSLPVYERPETTNNLSIEEQTFCTQYIRDTLSQCACQYPHRGNVAVNLDSYQASALIHDILTNISDAVNEKDVNLQQLTAEQMDEMKNQISSFFLHNLLSPGDHVRLILEDEQRPEGIIRYVFGGATAIYEPAKNACCRYDNGQIQTFEFLN